MKFTLDDYRALKAKKETLIAELEKIDKELEYAEAQLSDIDIMDKYLNEGPYKVWFVNHRYSPVWKEFSQLEDRTYYTYRDEETAKYASKLKRLNDMMLAFRYVFDKEFIPDWKNQKQRKYTVVYDNTTHKFESNFYYNIQLPIVVFSSEEIAQRCADWLNSVYPISELV